MPHTHKKKRQGKKNSVRSCIFGVIDETKEYSIYWLCDNATSPSYSYDISTLKLRGIVDYLQKISDINDITKTTSRHVFLVADSASLRKHSVQLVSFTQICLIYVYQWDDLTDTPNDKDGLPVQNTKLCGPFQDLEELFFTLSKNVRTMTCQPSMANQLPPLTSISKTVERSTSASYSYITDWYTRLMRALEEVPPSRTCKEKFTEECSLLYENNASVLQSIKEFSSTYTPEQAIRWYTRDGFVYKVLNRFLRERNQRAIQLLHFLIYDLSRQLKEELKTTEQEWMRADTVRLYRGQLMAMEELNQLIKNKGEELFVNSFLSMTTDLAVANMFAGTGSFARDSPIQSVIFHIEWVDFHPKKGLADVHRLSYNGDEGEILLSPTSTLNLLDCVYDEKERVWNATFTRLPPMNNPLIRVSDDECLMKLELTLRHLIDQRESSNDGMEEEILSDMEEGRFDFTRKFCSTFVEDVPKLRYELKLPELCSVTLNQNTTDRFELQTLRSFTTDMFDHGPKIDDQVVVTLYDALGTVYKTKGRCLEAYYYYQKASMYDTNQSQTSYTRQAHLAQIHKMNGDYELARNIFDELMDRTEDLDTFLFEDIAFAQSTTMSDEIVLQNSYTFIDYCLKDDDDDGDDGSEASIDERVSYIVDAWAELGYRYFYKSHDTNQALACYMREKELMQTSAESSSSYFNPLIGSCSERMGDVYASIDDAEKAVTLYREALDLAEQDSFVNNTMVAARCMCKIGRYSPNHEQRTFQHAFERLLCGYGKPYTHDTIGKCYLYLSRSLQRSQRYQSAFEYAKQAISIFLPDPLLLERLIDQCCDLIIELHRSLHSDHTERPTKEVLVNHRISLTDEDIKHMLQRTVEELKSELSSE